LRNAQQIPQRQVVVASFDLPIVTLRQTIFVGKRFLCQLAVFPMAANHKTQCNKQIVGSHAAIVESGKSFDQRTQT